MQQRGDAFSQRHRLGTRQHLGVAPHRRLPLFDLVAQLGSRREVVMNEQGSAALAAQIDQLVRIVLRRARGALEMKRKASCRWRDTTRCRFPVVSDHYCDCLPCAASFNFFCSSSTDRFASPSLFSYFPNSFVNAESSLSYFFRS